MDLPSEEDRHRQQELIQKNEEGGYWAKVPAIPSCATEG